MYFCDGHAEFSASLFSLRCHVILQKSWNSPEAFITFMHLADAFIQSDLHIQQLIQAVHIFVSAYVPWESNQQPLRC